MSGFKVADVSCRSARRLYFINLQSEERREFMKKLLALVTSLVMVAVMFTGCTSTELGFYSTAQ